jgi:hypothetical protein
LASTTLITMSTGVHSSVIGVKNGTVFGPLCDLDEGPAAVLRMQAWYRPRMETTFTTLDEVRAVRHTKADA